MHKFVKKLWWSDVGLSILLGVIFLQIFVMYPLIHAGTGLILLHILFILVLVSGVMAVSATPHWGRLVVVMAIFSIICRGLGLWYSGPTIDTLETSLAVIFAAILMAIILIQVFRQGPVNAHRIAGSIAAYLLIGIVCGHAYMIVALQDPSAFAFANISVPTEFHKLQSKLFYFSFITLTSVGYGDIMPVNPAAQTVAILEALIGQLFPAILLARLVSLEIENRQSRKRDEADE
jgi:voltage-gated potassium channel Kch